MLTLTKTAFYTRRTVNLTIIGIILFIVLKISWAGFSAYWQKIHPPPPPPPTVAFGKLPRVNIPTSSHLGEIPVKINYSLETIDNSLPEIDRLAKVFFMPHPSLKLLSFERAKTLAGKMGFKNEPLALSAILYQWNDLNYPGRTLKMDITSQNFTLNYDYAKEESVFEEKYNDSKEKAVQEVKDYLSDLSLFPEDLKEGVGEAQYLDRHGETFIQALGKPPVDAVRVNLFRRNIEEFNILGVKRKSSLTNLFLSGNRDRAKRFLAINYYYYPIDSENFATYPLKTAEEAWKELLDGEAFIISLNSADIKETLGIKKIYLAYLDTEDPQTYLQPIFVFEGEYDFLAYLPAIKEEMFQ
ncbi:MAG: hypothetical protein Q8N98_01520 [bacterium]|nr:hypothetical protein [bacterium]